MRSDMTRHLARSGSAVPAAGARALRALVVAGGLVVALAGLGWAGLQVQPASFPAAPQPAVPLEAVPVPAGLPAPVERFYRQTYGERAPVIRSAVLSGRGTLRLSGVTFPVRFRFIHAVGQSFRAYFELTLFGVPMMKVNEHFVGGKLRQEGTPAGLVESTPQLEQAANVRMWAEYLTWFPAALLTDPRVRWEPIDDATALLVVPFGEQHERLVVRFDPATGAMQYVEAMRYKGVHDPAKTLWISGIWMDEGTPWATWTIEDRAFNVPVDTSLATTGP
jgi:hypothetical protein